MAQFSIIKKSELEGAMRLDAEYYQPKYLKVSKQLRECGAIHLGELLSDVRYGIYTEPDYLEQGTDFIRALNLKELAIEGDVLKVKPSAVPNEKYLLRSGDVLIVRSGANVGNSGIVVDRFVGATFGSYTIRLRFKPSINPYVCYIFLKSKFGRLQTVRLRTGLAQPNINVPNLKQLQIVSRFPTAAQQDIENLVKQSHQEVFRSASLYLKAEQLLLDEIGFKDLDLSHQLCYTVPYRKTKEASRLDAEYFQPMYEEVENILSKRPRKTLESICSMINYGTVPTSPYTEEGMPYIKGSNLIDGFVQGKLDFLENTESLPKKFYTKEYDIIISQMGTVGKAGLVSKEQENWLFASFTIRARLLNNDFINPYVLTLYINNVAREWYLLRKIAQASVRQNTDLPTIKNLLVPKIAQDIQDKIMSILMESYELKNKSKRLFEIAKHKVEDLVEGKAS